MGDQSIPGFVEGRAVEGTGAAFENIHPGTGAIIGVVRNATAADVDAVVASPQRGFSQTEVGALISHAHADKVMD